MKRILVIAILFTLCSLTFAQTGVDRDLLAEISKIKAIDNHAHPLKYVAEGEKPDDEYDALPLDAIVAFPLPVRLSPTNLEFARAWHDLYRYAHDEPGGYAAGERYFPDQMPDRRYYVPVTRGLEIKIGEALAARRARDAKMHQDR